jgi:hypothetical protein
MVGGVLGDLVAQDAFKSTAREASVLLNDVWKSVDGGKTWVLVTAGCKAPQLDLILRGNAREGKWGDKTTQCRQDSDCYGNERCNATLGACVCQMWSPREQHAVATDEGYIYVLGGLTSPQERYCGPYACGDPWASAYTGFMNVSCGFFGVKLHDNLGVRGPERCFVCVVPLGRTCGGARMGRTGSW